MKPLAKMRRRRRLLASIDGMPFTGKTHFMLTLPPPAVILSTDYGLEGVVDDMEADGYDFTNFQVEDFTLGKPAFGSRVALDYAKRTALRFAEVYRDVLRRTERHSIGIDTGSEMWEIFRLADLGKLKQVPPMRYSRVNALFRDLIMEVNETPHNLVMIHRLKDKYDTKVVETDDGPKEVSVKVPGAVERRGFKFMDEMMQAVLVAERVERTGKPPLMGFTVQKCRQRAMLQGRRYRGSLATFPMLAMDVFPQSSPEDWMD